MPSHGLNRFQRSYTHTVDAPPDLVFPLLCPIREFEWLEHWDCELIHSDSGKVEKGCVFTNQAPGEAIATWVVTRHEPQARVVEFTTFVPESRVRTLEITVTGEPGGPSTLRWSHTFTALGKAGEEFLKAYSEEIYLRSMEFLDHSLNHFCRTGKRLPQPDPHHVHKTK